jgi:hypothetical protein
MLPYVFILFAGLLASIKYVDWRDAKEEAQAWASKATAAISTT